MRKLRRGSEKLYARNQVLLRRITQAEYFITQLSIFSKKHWIWLDRGFSLRKIAQAEILITQNYAGPKSITRKILRVKDTYSSLG